MHFPEQQKGVKQHLEIIPSAFWNLRDFNAMKRNCMPGQYLILLQSQHTAQNENASGKGFYNNKTIWFTWCCSVVHIIFTNAGVKVSGAAKYRPQQIQIIIISGTCSDCSYAFLMLPLITLHWSSLQQRLGCVWNISKGLSYFIPEMCIMHLFDYFSELP